MKDTNKSRDVSHTAYEHVRGAIQNGALKIGERVTEVALAEKFGVSRTPIREAVSRLEAEGLLTNVPRRGLIVTSLTHQQIVELYTMREILEGAAGRLTALSGSDTELAALKELIDSEADALEDMPRMLDINRQFHHLIALAAHNRYLLASIEQLSVTMSLLPSLLQERGRARIAHEQHIQIVDALMRRDGEAVEAAIREHVRSSQRHRMLVMLRGDS
ncbi:GntR family transcriptional regulator [Salipiger abyssi]|uniref:GntR family transcriptional regulator n=1 Tax=Salipiger abyssi TaxID=1250539 RepID=UPI001A8EBB10|nr:GntR family transcriptional regulator [Salipiger abyssi]MBN9887018.1 GntR family transcriptional regulator [Salipiger abyssi]